MFLLYSDDQVNFMHLFLGSGLQEKRRLINYASNAISFFTFFQMIIKVYMILFNIRCAKINENLCLIYYCGISNSEKIILYDVNGSCN